MSNTKIVQQVKDKIGLVFIHGAGLNSRIWEQVAAGLNCPYLLIDFPKQIGSKASRKGLTLQDYSAHINRQIDDWEVNKFIIVAHSLGGVLALQLANDRSNRLAGFVAIAAAIPASGGSFLSVLPIAKRLLMGALLRIFGTQPPESAIRQGLCNDLSAHQATVIVRDFVPESIHLYTNPVEGIIPTVPKLYLKLINDQEFNLAQQDRMIANLNPRWIQTLNSGHLPMLSKPEELLQALHTFLDCSSDSKMV